MIIILLIAVLNLSDSVRALCYHNWIEHDSSCYLVIDTPETWAEAMLHCKALAVGGGLAEIDTQTENDFLKKLLMTHTQNITHDVMYWIGGSDSAKEGEWYWVKSDEPLDFTDWNPGQPDDSGHQEDCMEMHKILHFHWDDRPCHSRFPFICEQWLVFCKHEFICKCSKL